MASISDRDIELAEKLFLYPRMSREAIESLPIHDQLEIEALLKQEKNTGNALPRIPSHERLEAKLKDD